jgi:L-aminopeptidase/D-esterase-like protein
MPRRPLVVLLAISSAEKPPTRGPAGSLDAITDVGGVEGGQTTIIRGDDIRTGVTAVLPHGGNL